MGQDGILRAVVNRAVLAQIGIGANLGPNTTADAYVELIRRNLIDEAITFM